MPEFEVNATRTDPYKNFKFRVWWGGRMVAGISKVSALVRETEVVDYRVGGEVNAVRRMPGRTKFEPVTLERGVTHDVEFERWAGKVWDPTSTPGSESSLKDFRKDIVLQLLNEAGQVVKAWRLFRCWVSKYQALPELDANANAVAFESITLQNEGWERDVDVQEPVEPTLDPFAAAATSARAPANPVPAFASPPGQPGAPGTGGRRPSRRVLSVDLTAPTKVKSGQSPRSKRKRR